MIAGTLSQETKSGLPPTEALWYTFRQVPKQYTLKAIGMPRDLNTHIPIQESFENSSRNTVAGARKHTHTLTPKQYTFTPPTHQSHQHIQLHASMLQ